MTGTIMEQDAATEAAFTEAAFNEYVQARRKVDETMNFEDGLLAAQAWRKFQNLFLGNTDKLESMDAIKAKLKHTMLTVVQ